VYVVVVRASIFSCVCLFITINFPFFFFFSTPNVKKLMFLHAFLWQRCYEILPRLQEASRESMSDHQKVELDDTPCCPNIAWLLRTLMLLGKPAGACSPPALDDTRVPRWLVSLSQQECVHTQAGGTPSPRIGQSMCRWRNHLVLYGGKGTDGKALPDSCVYLLDTTCPAWLKIECRVGPPARFHHSALVIDDRMLVFGGGTGAGNLADLWEFDLLRHKWVQIEPSQLAAEHEQLLHKQQDGVENRPPHSSQSPPQLPSQATENGAQPLGWGRLGKLCPPQARFGHSAVLGAQGRVVLFGGHDGTMMHNDVFGLELSPTPRWYRLHDGKASSAALPPGLDLPPPSPRALHSALVAQQRMWVFGGRSPEGTAYGDLHVWDIGL
jgi:Kelch motif/Galactose oxidase, central domain